MVSTLPKQQDGKGRGAVQIFLHRMDTQITADFGSKSMDVYEILDDGEEDHGYDDFEDRTIPCITAHEFPWAVKSLPGTDVEKCAVFPPVV